MSQAHVPHGAALDIEHSTVQNLAQLFAGSGARNGSDRENITETPKEQKILVVDDDEEWRQFLSDALSPPYTVVASANGDEALAMARTAHPSLIFLDVMMPGGRDGFAIFCDLRKDPATRTIPVIMLSEVVWKTELPFGGESMERYLGAAPTAFLEKPISAERLLAEVRKALDEGSSDR